MEESMFKSKWLILIVILMVGLLGLSACGDDEEPAEPNAPVGADQIDPTTLSGDEFEGGWVFNDWTDGNASDSHAANYPAAPEPAYTDNNNLVKCKGCHGWDGLGEEGGYASHAEAAGVLPLDRGNIDVQALEVHRKGVENLANLEAQQMVDVVEFLNVGVVITDYADIDVSDPSAVVYTWTTADKAAGQTQYEATCQGCHGVNGVAVPPTGTQWDGAEFGLDNTSGIGHYISGSGKPSEEFHKLLYGENDTMSENTTGVGGDGQGGADVIDFITSNLVSYPSFSAGTTDDGTTACAAGTADSCRFFTDGDINFVDSVPGVNVTTGTWDPSAALGDTTAYPFDGSVTRFP